jgi:hypothetical protein
MFRNGQNHAAREAICAGSRDAGSNFPDPLRQLVKQQSGRYRMQSDHGGKSMFRLTNFRAPRE